MKHGHDLGSDVGKRLRIQLAFTFLQGLIVQMSQACLCSCHCPCPFALPAWSFVSLVVSSVWSRWFHTRRFSFLVRAMVHQPRSDLWIPASRGPGTGKRTLLSVELVLFRHRRVYWRKCLGGYAPSSHAGFLAVRRQQIIPGQSKSRGQHRCFCAVRMAT